ncbi:hypothetical protein ACIGBH_11925 [Streptomyces sp. NPDC085929]|uniref:hypothetical protein n=1 Tax=Streptomyces sp. NPDC085929 TaxID=3365739 RepID=UPI0037D3AC50
MDTQTQWRVRATEKIALSSALWAEHERILDVSPLRGVLADILPRRIKAARLHVPIASFPRLPLLEFNVSVAGEPAYRVSRATGAVIEARHVEQQANAAGIGFSPALRLFLEQMFTAGTGKWRLMLDEGESDPWEYLNEGLERTVGPDEYHAWKERVECIKDLVRDFVPPDECSPSENPLIALPYMHETGNLLKLRTDFGTDCTGVLDELISFISEAPNSEMAAAAVASYASYGRFWTAFAECAVPVDEPFTISVSERRMIDFENSEKGDCWSKFRMVGVVSRPISYHDAYSNQISLRVTDSNVELADEWDLREDTSNRNRPKFPEEVVRESELLYLQSSEETRPARLILKSALRPTAPIRWIYRLVLATASLTILAIVVGYSWILHRLTAGHLALLLTPSTFATSLLLVRESSPLSTALTRNLRLTLVWLLAAVWLLTATLYLGKQIFLTETPPKTPPMSCTASPSGSLWTIACGFPSTSASPSSRSSKSVAPKTPSSGATPGHGSTTPKPARSTSAARR